MDPWTPASVSTHDCGCLPSSSFVFTSGVDGLIASGVRWLAPGGDPSWAAHYRAFRKSLTDPGAPKLLVGALPFDHDRPAHLFRPESVRAFIDLAGDSTRAASPSLWRARPEPPLAEFERNVATALDRIRDVQGPAADVLRKVVLSRSLVLTCDAPIDPADVFARLRRDPSVTTFSVPLPSARSGVPRTLVGATPELLIEKTGAAVVSLPLAGSAPRAVDAGADAGSAERLLHSEKDRREHRAVVEWIADRLAPYCQQLTVPGEPSLVSTRFMWHLGTRISGTLADGDVSSLELAEILHPTPAVCGRPVDAARALIGDLERFDRGFFAGAVGWCDDTGDGRWMMTIRCADIEGDTARLYAGAGIVHGSDPVAEGAETSAKFAALLDALGIDESGRQRTGAGV